MAETVTTLERAVAVLDERGHMGCHWRIAYGPDGSGSANGYGGGKYCAINGPDAIAVANQLRDAEAKDEPDDQVDLEELGSIAYGAAMIAFWSGGGNYPFGTQTLPWDELVPSVRRGWIAAAVAVVDQMPAAEKPSQIGPMTERMMGILKCVAAETTPRGALHVEDRFSGRKAAILMEDLVIALRECGMEGDSR